jgi:hypothetical protein
VTLLEMLAALAIAAMLTIVLVRVTQSSFDDTKGELAGQHQQRVASAARQYIAANRATLLTSATATSPVKVSVGDLQTAGFLSSSIAATNPYGQTPCLLVLQPSAGTLEALLVTEGGPTPISQGQLPFVAANSGDGGGYVAYASPPTAQGAYGAWSVSAPQLTSYLSASCTGTAAAPGSLATALFDTDTAQADFVYRGAVPGHPELNQMSTPLGMAAVAVEGDTTDPRCTALDPTTQGRIAVDSQGRVLSCQAGTWTGQGSAYWKDPVATYASLPVIGNNAGDVRMALDVSRAFTWNGVSWVALSVDQDGNFSVPGTSSASLLQVTSSQTAGTPCASAGLISIDSSGLLLSCQSGLWSRQSTTELAYTEQGDQVIMASSHMSYAPGTVFYSGTYGYDPTNDNASVMIERDVTPDKNGEIIISAWSQLAIGTVTNTNQGAQFQLFVQLVDRDTGTVLADNFAMSANLHDDDAILPVTLSKPVPKNTNGYAVQMFVYWTNGSGNFAGQFWNRADYYGSGTTPILEYTPLEIGWTLDMIY